MIHTLSRARNVLSGQAWPHAHSWIWGGWSPPEPLARPWRRCVAIFHRKLRNSLQTSEFRAPLQVAIWSTTVLCVEVQCCLRHSSVLIFSDLLFCGISFWKKKPLHALAWLLLPWLIPKHLSGNVSSQLFLESITWLYKIQILRWNPDSLSKAVMTWHLCI